MRSGTWPVLFTAMNPLLLTYCPTLKYMQNYLWNEGVEGNGVEILLYH